VALQTVGVVGSVVAVRALVSPLLRVVTSERVSLQETSLRRRVVTERALESLALEVNAVDVSLDAPRIL